ncbi:MAG: sodium:calcium antiporter [Candidatus Odinarchaeia archaeon]
MRGEDKKPIKKILTVPLMLIISLTVVIFSAEFVVNSALNITIGFWTSPLVIGAKIVSVGTSLPELTLDFQAVRHGHVHLAIGDILGSNLTNLTLVLGLTLILTSFHVGVCVVPGLSVCGFILLGSGCVRAALLQAYSL